MAGTGSDSDPALYLASTKQHCINYDLLFHQGIRLTTDLVVCPILDGAEHDLDDGANRAVVVDSAAGAWGPEL